MRSSAISILAELRSIAPVKMLTSATREYALEHNTVFSLGFQDEEIIAREDFLETVYGAYGSVDHVTDENTCPSGVLIDNQSPDDIYAKLKMAFLGIGPDRYFEIRDYFGEEDPAEFAEELADLLARVRDRIFQIPEITNPL